jgi:large subunit ribosomal protein L6
MSRIGKQEIVVPNGVTMNLAGGVLSAKGPKGENSRPVNESAVEVKIEDGKLTFTPRRNDKEARALWGTYASLAKSMIKGVQAPFEKKLIMEGVGFKWEVAGKDIKLALGFSHPVAVAAVVADDDGEEDKKAKPGRPKANS